MSGKGFDISSAIAFDNVAAGHDGILSDPSGALIYKPCTPAEIDFYQTTVSDHPEFARLMPTFMGTLQHGRSGQVDDILASEQGQEHVQAKSMLLPTPELENAIATGIESAAPLKGKKLETDHVVVLENVLAGFKRPNFMDIKLGKRLWADDALPAKRAKLDDVASTTTSGSLGFRIAGMQVWEPSNSKTTEGKYRSYDKLYGRGLTSVNVKDAFDALLSPDESTNDYLEDIIRDIDSSIEEIETVVASSESRMYSASLLLVFEGDAGARQDIINAAITRAQQGEEEELERDVMKEGRDHVENDGEEEEEDEDDDDKKLFDVKVIDFAHAQWVPGQGQDENFLFGVRNVRKILQGLVRSTI